MLGKLIKYEFKATSRMFLLMYAALILVAAINSVLLIGGLNAGLYTSGNDLVATIYSIISALAATVYFFAMFAVSILTFVVIVVRFYRLFGDEGYLWFTLPATPNQHLISKLIVALVWSLASGVVIMLSLGILFIGQGWVQELWRIPQLIGEMIAMGYNPLLWLVLILIMALVATVSGFMMFFTAIAIGPNLTKSRLGGSVLAYILVYVITQIVATIQMVVLVFPISQINAQSYRFEAIPGSAIELLAPSAVDQVALGFFGIFIVGYTVMMVGYYLVTRYFMTKKLNLP